MKIFREISAKQIDSLNLAHHLLMAFSDLEKQKHTNFLEKQYTGAHANIGQKPYGATLTSFLVLLKSQFQRESNKLGTISKKWNPKHCLILTDVGSPTYPVFFLPLSRPPTHLRKSYPHNIYLTLNI